MADLIFWRRWTSLLELVRQPQQHVVQHAAGLAGLHHGDVQVVERLRVLRHGRRQRRALLDVRRARAIRRLGELLALCCSARIDSARRIGRPEFTMVANCREKIASSFSLTFAGRRLISRFRPLLLLADLERRCSPSRAGARGPGARCRRPRVPVTRLPDLSRTLYVIGLRHSSPPDHHRRPSPWLAPPSMPRRGGRRRPRGAGAPRGRGTARTPSPGVIRPAFTSCGERHVHRLHAEAAARLHRRVDLVHLALADQVADRRRGDEHLARRRPGPGRRRSGAAAG